MLALIAIGVAKLACCQPVAVSPAKVARPSRVPVLLQTLAVWVPVFRGPL